jgi:hypothetical protein
MKPMRLVVARNLLNDKRISDNSSELTKALFLEGFDITGESEYQVDFTYRNLRFSATRRHLSDEFEINEVV